MKDRLGTKDPGLGIQAKLGLRACSGVRKKNREKEGKNQGEGGVGNKREQQPDYRTVCVECLTTAEHV